MASRKDYHLLAAALREERPGATWSANKWVQWMLDCRAVAKALALDNPRFDKEKFLNACGWDDIPEEYDA